MHIGNGAGKAAIGRREEFSQQALVFLPYREPVAELAAVIADDFAIFLCNQCDGFSKGMDVGVRWLESGAESVFDFYRDEPGDYDLSGTPIDGVSKNQAPDFHAQS